MLKFLLPNVTNTPFKAILLNAGLGALMAAIFGAIHDQVTYSIGPSYFHHFKFDQFEAFDFNLPPRVFASIIGILASWWVGLIIGWILARVAHSRHSVEHATRRSRRALFLTFAITILCGIIAYFVAINSHTEANLDFWQRMIPAIDASNAAEFRIVGYIHNAGYLGAVLGCIIAIFYATKQKKVVAESDSNE